MRAAMTSLTEPSPQATGLRTTGAFCRRSAHYSPLMQSPMHVDLYDKEKRRNARLEIPQQCGQGWPKLACTTGSKVSQNERHHLA